MGEPKYDKVWEYRKGFNEISKSISQVCQKNKL